MPGAGDRLPPVNPGDPIKASGWNELIKQINLLTSTGSPMHCISTGIGIFCRPNPKGIQEHCPYYWEFELAGGSDAPTSGSQIWNATLNGDAQDITVDYDETAATMGSHILSQFSAMTADDLEVTGGPLPEIPITVRWRKKFANYAAQAWPPTVGTNSLNNSTWMKCRQINPRITS